MPHIDASSATTRTQPKRRRFDLAKWTAVEVRQPCALLMGCDSNLIVLLAKHRRASPHGELLHALRLVTIPNGFRLRLLELKASLGTAHLPDEWLHMRAFVISRFGWSHLFVDGEVRASRADGFPIRPLTALQYQTLVSCSGRHLRAVLVSLFENCLPPAVVAHRPWKLSPAGGSRAFGGTRYAG